jgi:hypothetical protein
MPSHGGQPLEGRCPSGSVNSKFVRLHLMGRRINKHYFTICQRGDNDSFHSTHLCLITTNVAHADAISFHRIRSFELMTLKCQYTYIP